MEIMEQQKQLIAAKKENLDSSRRIEELYSEAMKAMRSYSGEPNNNQFDIHSDGNKHD